MIKRSTEDRACFLADLQAKALALYTDCKSLPPYFFFLAIGQLYREWEKQWEDNPTFPILLFGDLEDFLLATKKISLPYLNEMKSLAEAYENISDPIQRQALEQLSWKHHITLIKKVKNPQDRLFYLRRTCASGWNVDEMKRQIDTDLHMRTGCMLTNFEHTLAPDDVLLARDSFNSPVDFCLPLPDRIADERHLTNLFTKNVDHFLHDLGHGFAYIQEQRRLGGFVFDFLLYHARLNCYIIVEIKMQKCTPEYIGKMTGYLAAADKFLKKQGQNNSIGLIYCPDMDEEKVMPCLKNYTRPIGVATYFLNGMPVVPERRCRQLSQIPQSRASLSPK